ncbi:hypothetical protein D3C81_1812790 [compost metagenome]
MRISPEENQSSCSPRSRNSWKARIATLSEPKPIQSSLACLSGGVSRTYLLMPNNASRPMGRLMKNTQRQLRLSVNQPPSMGPSTGPTITDTPNRAMAEPRSRSL